MTKFQIFVSVSVLGIAMGTALPAWADGTAPCNTNSGAVGNTLEAQIEGTGTVDPAAPAAAGATSGVMGTVSGLLDRDGDGNPLNDVLGMAKGFFGSKT